MQTGSMLTLISGINFYKNYFSCRQWLVSLITLPQSTYPKLLPYPKAHFTAKPKCLNTDQICEHIQLWCMVFQGKCCKIFCKTPEPLSTTSNKSAPQFLRWTSMLFAPASKLFSTNSFTAVARVTTTCPEQIWWTDRLSNAFYFWSAHFASILAKRMVIILEEHQ